MGFETKSYAPFFIASTARAMVPCPVMTITTTSGSSAPHRLEDEPCRPCPA